MLQCNALYLVFSTQKMYLDFHFTEYNSIGAIVSKEYQLWKDKSWVSVCI